MVKTLLKQIGGYKKDTIITPIFTVLEVVAEVLVPFVRSEEHTSELQSPSIISYAVFCLKKIFF